MGKGKRKIEIKKVECLQARNVTFTKRRNGLFKKAQELTRLFPGVQVAIVAFSPAGNPFVFGDPLGLSSLLSPAPSGSVSVDLSSQISGTSSVSAMSVSRIQDSPVSVDCYEKDPLDLLSQESPSCGFDPASMVKDFQDSPLLGFDSMVEGFLSFEEATSAVRTLLDQDISSLDLEGLIKYSSELQFWKAEISRILERNSVPPQPELRPQDIDMMIEELRGGRFGHSNNF